MDTSTQVTEVVSLKGQARVISKRQYRTVEQKRRIVEETLLEGASVARVARAHGVNANQVFDWRRQHLAGRLDVSGAMKLLPVRVSESSSARANGGSDRYSPSAEFSKSMPGTIHIELRQAQVRIAGNADPGLLRVLLECLQR